MSKIIINIEAETDISYLSNNTFLNAVLDLLTDFGSPATVITLDEEESLLTNPNLVNESSSFGESLERSTPTPPTLKPLDTSATTLHPDDPNIWRGDQIMDEQFPITSTRQATGSSTVSCPTCGAKAGHFCRRMQGRGASQPVLRPTEALFNVKGGSSYHTSRAEKAKKKK